MRSKRNRKILEEYFDEFGINEEEMRLPVSALDNYTQTKLIYLRWLIAKPRVLFCESPGAREDVCIRDMLIPIIRKTAKTGAAVIVCTSDIKEVISTCDKMQIIKDGRTKNIFTHTEFSGVTSKDIF